MTSIASKRARGGAFPVWVVIVVGGLLTSASLGIRGTFGLFLDPIVDSVLDGVQGPFGLAVAIQAIVWGLSQPVAGAIADRYGAAVTFFGGSVLYAGSLLLLSTADSSAMVVFSAGFLTGIAVGAASFAVVLSAVGRMVSAEKRSMALGIVSALGSLGQFVSIPLARWLINTWSWRVALVVFAAIIAATVVFTPALRGSARRHFPEPEDTGTDRTLRDELRRAARARPYLLLNAAFFVCGFHVTFIGTYLPRHGIDLGHESAAVTALALVGLFNVIGSFTAGALGGRYSKTMLLAGIYAARALFIAVYMLVPASPTVTLIFGGAIGLLWLSTVPLTSAMVSEQFGTTHAGALFGLVFLSHQFGALLGALMGANLYDIYGSYNLVWWIAVALAVFAMVMHLMIEEGPIPEAPIALNPRRGGLAPAGALSSVLAVIGIASITMAATGAGAAEADDLLAWCFSVISG